MCVCVCVCVRKKGGKLSKLGSGGRASEDEKRGFIGPRCFFEALMGTRKHSIFEGGGRFTSRSTDLRFRNFYYYDRGGVVVLEFEEKVVGDDGFGSQEPLGGVRDSFVQIKRGRGIVKVYRLPGIVSYAEFKELCKILLRTLAKPLHTSRNSKNLKNLDFVRLRIFSRWKNQDNTINFYKKIRC